MNQTVHPPREPLLATKIHVPITRSRLVARARLVQQLNEALEQRLALISAPAGYGKTTLVSSWVQSLKTPVAWLSLDEADNDPTRFLSYLVATLQTIVASTGRTIQGSLEGAQPPLLDPAIGVLLNDLMALATNFILVLDDFHTIDNALIHQAIQTLVAHQPPQMRLVIVTREDPQLPLARLRARGQLVELRAHDLRFTPAEVSTFLKDVMGLTLAPKDVDELDNRIEGWIAGLQLAALSIKKSTDPSELIAGLSGSHHFILSYLTEEVLRQLPPAVESFLLQTSVLDRLNASLCNAVTGRQDSEAVLKELYTSNLFVIPLDEEHSWYRYHHLFADLLRGQLKRTQAELIATLHARASIWHEQQGTITDAIEHAFTAGDYERTMHLLEVHARSVVLQGYAQTVEGWLRRVPEEWRVAGPRANLAFTWSLLLRGQLGEIAPYLRNAEAAGGADPAVRAEVLALRAALVSLGGDTEAGCDLAEAAVAEAPEDDPYVESMARFTLATAHNYAGRVAKAVESYRQALPLCRDAGNTLASMLIVSNLGMLYIAQGRLHDAASLCLPVIEAVEQTAGAPTPALATVYGIHSELLYARGEVDALEHQLEKHIALARQGGHVAAVTYGQISLSRVLQARGDFTAARAALDEATALLGQRMPPWVTAQVVAQQVALALAQGDDATALHALTASGVSAEEPPHHGREVIQIAWLRLFYYLGRQGTGDPYLEQALALADRLLDAAEAAGRRGRSIEILTLRALIHAANRAPRPALDDLGRSLAWAAPEGYVTLFVNEGLPMQLLLADYRSRLERRPESVEIRAMLAHIDKLLVCLRAISATTAAAPQAETAPSHSESSSKRRSPFAVPELVEPLSEREVEVLRLMADGLTYQEAADQLMVSLNTIRFHVKGIYGKLGVDRRAAAIDRARGLGLI
jgi:LuxR family transcriptional regulator, maltose regulon positive regulatory protein